MTTTFRNAFFAALALAAFPLAATPVERLEPAANLATMRRIFVEQLGGGQTSDQMRDMIIAALQNSGLFVITENQERADVTLRGSSDDKTFLENHNTSDTIGLHTDVSAHSSSKNYQSGVSAGHSTRRRPQRQRDQPH